MPDLDFDLSVVSEPDGGSRLTLRGELDLATTGRLQKALARAEPPIVLDLSRLTFMDSTGVRVLLEAAEAMPTGLRMIPPAGGDARLTIDETGIGAVLPLEHPGNGP